MRKIIVIPAIFSILFTISTHAEERSETLTKCRLSIKNFSQNYTEYRMTLFLYDKLNDREILFKNKFGFVLPLNTHSYNFIKTAYVLNKKLCVEYFDTGGNYIINRMFDDYLIDG